MASFSFHVGAQAFFQRIDGNADSYDRGNCVQQTRDGGFVVAGSTISEGAVGPNGENVKDVYVVKTDAGGKSGELKR